MTRSNQLTKKGTAERYKEELKNYGLEKYTKEIKGVSENKRIRQNLDREEVGSCKRKGKYTVWVGDCST